jgi:hypothetical protein
MIMDFSFLLSIGFFLFFHVWSTYIRTFIDMCVPFLFLPIIGASLVILSIHSVSSMLFLV